MPALTLSIDVETLGHDSHKYHLIATREEREEIAKRLNLLSLEKLEANLLLIRKGRLHLKGKVIADVTQECVRTLQPLAQQLEFDADEIFTLTPLDEKEEYVLSEEGLIEPLEGTTLDVGEVVIQTLSLNLDPFPVSPTSTPIEYTERGDSSSPFSILKKP